MREPVVFLPDLLCDARLFGPQIAELSRDFAVMVAPLNGERIEEMASQLLDVLPKRSALVGCGLGGAVALEVTRRAPDRVARLCLVATSPLAETPQQAAERDPWVVRTKAGRFREVLVEALRLRDLTPGPFREEISGLLLDMAERMGAEGFIRQVRAMQRRRDQQSLLRKIMAPTMVICGARDEVLPVKRQEIMAELIPGAHLRVLTEAAHVPMLEQPEEVIEDLRAWLRLPLMLR
jgi:pimeloyl-ACP methyl ester carboxylesterase